MSRKPHRYDEVEDPAIVRVLRMIDALPRDLVPDDDTPLRQNLPGVWPTLGDLREAVRLMGYTDRLPHRPGRNP